MSRFVCLSIASALFCVPALLASSIANPGFETGDFTSWTAGGDTTVTGGTYGSIAVYSGTSYALLGGGYVSRDQVESALGLTSGSLPGYLTAGSFIYQDVSLTAGQTVTEYANFYSDDYCCFDDTGLWSLTGPGVNTFGVIGDTNSIGQYNSTGWIPVNLTAAGAGTYRIGFAVFNGGDNSLPSHIGVDDGPTVESVATPEPGTLSLVGVAGLALVARLRRRK